MKRVFVSILNFNGFNNTKECLLSLKEAKLPQDINLHVIVVDNNSKEPFNLREESFKDLRLKVIKNKTNLGFSGGHNVAIRYALEQRADYILILNNDTIVDKNLVCKLLERTKNFQKTGIVAPKIYFAPGFEFHKQRYKKEDLGKVIWYAGGIMDWENVIGHHRGVDEVDHAQYDKVEETDFASGACFLIKKNVIERLGMFDEKYFLYYEDNDLSQRVKRTGFKVLYEPNAILWHKNAGSAGGSGSSLQDYYITRNRLLFGLRYAPPRSKLSLFQESIRLLFVGRFWQKRGVIDFYMGNFGKGSFRF